MTGDVTPIILLSAPRSGSTLVQRVLAAHTRVATTAEPWILLSLLGTQRPDLPGAGGWQRDTALAMRDFCGALPAGQADLDAVTRDAALRLYRLAAGPDATHFVDKTPPYALIIDDIVRVLPEAKLVFLWRNPVSVVASIVETFAGGAWRPNHYPLSLFENIPRLVAGCERHRDRAISVRFEDLVTGDADAWRGLVEALGVEFDAAALDAFASVRLQGIMGDPTGVNRYRALSDEPVNKWRATVDNPVRVAWTRRYLRWLGRERLETMGYDLDDLLAGLRDAPHGAHDGVTDFIDLVDSAAREVVKARAGGSHSSTWRRLLSA